MVTDCADGKLTGKVIDFGSWLDYITFDVMGDLGFSKAFGLLNDGMTIDDPSAVKQRS